MYRVCIGLVSNVCLGESPSFLSSYLIFLFNSSVQSAARVFFYCVSNTDPLLNTALETFTSLMLLEGRVSNLCLGVVVGVGFGVGAV